jgi:hypothetical protein
MNSGHFTIELNGLSYAVTWKENQVTGKAKINIQPKPRQRWIDEMIRQTVRGEINKRYEAGSS